MSDARFLVSKRITIPSLVALSAGFLLGVVAMETKTPWLMSLEQVGQPARAVWINALQMIVLPLITSATIATQGAAA